MAKAGSAAALAALGALGAMALRNRGKKEDDDAEDIRKAVKGAPRPSDKEVDEENLKPSVPKTEVQPAHMTNEAVSRAIINASPAKYDAGRLSNRPTRAPRSVAPATVDRAAAEADRMAGESSRLASFVEGRQRPERYPMKKGGVIKSSKPTVSHASKRADGIAQRGKTKGRYL